MLSITSISSENYLEFSTIPSVTHPPTTVTPPNIQCLPGLSPLSQTDPLRQPALTQPTITTTTTTHHLPALQQVAVILAHLQTPRAVCALNNSDPTQVKASGKTTRTEATAL